MIVIVGLGNPGKKYLNTRHNIGFEAIDQLAKENKFPEFKLSKKFNALVSKEKEVILAKPQAFMNNSGQSVKLLYSFYKPKELIVIHDDIDLSLGKIRVSKNRGSAGHKGVESIIKELGTKDFTRIRIGIQPEKDVSQNVEKFVLQKFKKLIRSFS
jgi:PTH1 family peptidyl-tRNA hydrolase